MSYYTGTIHVGKPFVNKKRARMNHIEEIVLRILNRLKTLLFAVLLHLLEQLQWTEWIIRSHAVTV